MGVRGYCSEQMLNCVSRKDSQGVKDERSGSRTLQNDSTTHNIRLSVWVSGVGVGGWVYVSVCGVGGVGDWVTMVRKPENEHD